MAEVQWLDRKTGKVERGQTIGVVTKPTGAKETWKTFVVVKIQRGNKVREIPIDKIGT